MYKMNYQNQFVFVAYLRYYLKMGKTIRSRSQIAFYYLSDNQSYRRVTLIDSTFDTKGSVNLKKSNLD